MLFTAPKDRRRGLRAHRPQVGAAPVGGGHGGDRRSNRSTAWLVVAIGAAAAATAIALSLLN